MKTWIMGSTVLSIVVATGCGGEKTSAAEPAPTVAANNSKVAVSTEGSSGASAAETDPQKAAEQMKEGLKQFNGGKDIKAIEPAELKKLFPETIGAAKRSNAKSEHMNMMGMDIATAEADYEPEVAEGAEQHPSFHVKITDLGNVSGAMLGGFAGWAVMSHESETETGYEKTVQYKGFPGQETYDRESKYGSLNVYVAKRFTIEAHGNDATIEELRAIVDGIDVAKLSGMGK